MAGRLGRSVAAVRAQAQRLAPPGVRIERGEALEWLAARLAEDESYDWRPAFEGNRRMNRALARHRVAKAGALPTPGVAGGGKEPGVGGTSGNDARREGGDASGPRLLRPATTEQLDEVVRDWQYTTGHVLDDERRTVFLRRSEVTALAHVDPASRAAAALRLWSGLRRLLVAEWLLEILCPGVVVGPAPDTDQDRPSPREPDDLSRDSSTQSKPATPRPIGAEVLPSPEEIEAARTPAGGWTRKQLAEWGVPWPAPKGWKKHLADRWRAARATPEGRRRVGG
ncbi:hypothetical protein [Embleya sp. NPDC005575]|uniref:hypothetical protein n=1 Tax=Embleya sp. NPDC005575 TaxID=3156892 RepID=UPI0033BEE615